MEEQMSGMSLVFLLVWAIVVIVPFWKISEKAGFSGWLSLLILVPLANLGFLYYLGFAKWPSQGK